MRESTKPSSNWLALQKTLGQHGPPRKRRKVDGCEPSALVSNKTSINVPPLSPIRQEPDNQNENIDLETTEVKNGESIAALRKMVLGKVEYMVGSQAIPGKYLALDCEMVGVGIEGNESSLARVSIVNYTGAVILDVFVRQRERVVDYRTQWSGVRSTDLASSAKPFKEVQQTVAELIKDRVLVGHAIYNDLKALLLSHPSLQIRDTQSLAYKHRVVRSRRPALRVLVKQELGIVIQGGEHSSVTDARATMALFRLYKKQWESGFKSSHGVAPSRTKDNTSDDPASKAGVQRSPSSHPSFTFGRKRRPSELSGYIDGDAAESAESPCSSSGSRTNSPSLSSTTRIPAEHLSVSSKNHGERSQPPTSSIYRKGISSGISTVTKRANGIKEVRRQGKRLGNNLEKANVVGEGSRGRKLCKVEEKWWKTLGGGKKCSIKS